MKNKDIPETNIEKYNYLKSIKEKEQIIIEYYNKINHLNTDKPKPLIKPKKRTRKNLHKEEHTNNKEEKEKEEKEEKKDKEDKDKYKKEIEKKTKKNIVIMDD
jgi:hypothetical protein